MSRDNKIAVIGSGSAKTDQLYNTLLDYLYQKDSNVFAAGEYFNVRDFRAAAEIQVIEKLGAWSEFKETEIKKKSDWLLNDPGKAVIVKVTPQNFEDNPNLSDLLTRNFKLVFENRVTEWDDPFTILKNSKNSFEDESSDFLFVLEQEDYPVSASDSVMQLDKFQTNQTEFLAKNIYEKAVQKEKKCIIFYLSKECEARQLALIKKLKEFPQKMKIVISGQKINFQYAQMLRQGWVDLIVREKNWVQMLNWVQCGNDVGNHSGALWLGNDRVIKYHRPLKAAAEKTEKILLVLMPAWNNLMPPFGLAHISAALKEAGYNVTVLDLNRPFWERMKSKFVDCAEFENVQVWTDRENFEREVNPFLEETYSLLKQSLQNQGYSFIGFSVFLTNAIVSEKAFRIVRSQNDKIKIFCGGPNCSREWSDKLLEEGHIDAAIFGEGEISVVELLNMYTEQKDLVIEGLDRRSAQGEIRRGPTRKLSNINLLPTPDFSEFDIYDYDDVKLPIYFSRGCVARCTFCSETEYWVRFRIITVDKLVASIKRLVENYGIYQFQFNDSLMNGSHRHLQQFVDAVIEQNLQISFHGYCRLEPELTPELLNKMAKAGCKEIAFGMESGSQKVLDLMKKEVRVENFVPIVKSARAAGIRSSACVIVGYPGEGWLDFFKTCLLLWRLRGDISILNISIMSLGFGSKMTKELEDFGIHAGRLREWRTNDGKNTPSIRYVRYRILKTLWKLCKKLPFSSKNWNSGYSLSKT